MTSIVVEQAPAKVNLYLHVTGRRADGYHLLESLVVFAEVGDRVTARSAPAGTLSLEVTGPAAGALDGAAEDNLVLRAARALRHALGDPGLGAVLTLEKTLPVASGIGGGSADAAATLRALTRLWGRAPSPAALAALAASLGADVPVCLAGRPALMAGIGESLSPLAGSLPAIGIVLANPGVALSTPAVFQGLGGRFGPADRLEGTPATVTELVAALGRRRNDLEAPAIAACPTIAGVLTALSACPGVLLARMSGSGATCFGLCADAATASAAAETLRVSHPGWWVAGGGLARPPGAAEPCVAGPVAAGRGAAGRGAA
ncbi:4-(cytidine 5'-diphospho)-2-C-methyl-D-erythritol kinase [Zavarzinia compransoris]|uniref:4-(cytidine 5'-diphospho)-2-C-methyl-D-erythritol kinase n=1 Tax=Zavarzinia marina TaxID=2911065 RepID=UPI001F43807C|nr:4-(cytidine 5'-diphospho)-2-C-methyl-D-erythritol kinase [Zavarzinia marina]MCF4165120.1 4-(cytidine 5'-diphospho)-2-C-methyl-D-erythritol kinase [Zavarzinia marina]